MVPSIAASPTTMEDVPFSTGIPVMPQQWNQSEQYIEGEHASIQNLRLSHVKTQLEALHFQLFSSNLPTSAAG